MHRNLPKQLNFYQTPDMESNQFSSDFLVHREFVRVSPGPRNRCVRSEMPHATQHASVLLMSKIYPYTRSNRLILQTARFSSLCFVNTEMLKLMFICCYG